MIQPVETILNYSGFEMRPSRDDAFSSVLSSVLGFVSSFFRSSDAQQVEREVAEQVEREVEPHVEREVEPQVEREVEPHAEREVEQEVDEEVEQEVDEKVEEKVEQAPADPLKNFKSMVK